MSPVELSDEALILRYRETSGIDKEFCIDEVFRRHYSQVARWCLRFTHDRESAADLAQDVFTRAYQHLDSFQGNSRFSTWLFTIARNHCLNTVRANAREATQLRADVEEGFFDQLRDTTESPAVQLDRDASERLVRSLLAESLDDTEKSVFTLHYGEEVPLDAITRLLQLDNVSGAKAYIVSAKRKLARTVARWRARNNSSIGQKSGVSAFMDES